MGAAGHLWLVAPGRSPVFGRLSCFSGGGQYSGGALSSGSGAVSSAEVVGSRCSFVGAVIRLRRSFVSLAAMGLLDSSGDWVSGSQACILKRRDWVVRTSDRSRSTLPCCVDSVFVLLFCLVLLCFCSVGFYFCSVCFWFWLVRSLLRTMSHFWRYFLVIFLV